MSRTFEADHTHGEATVRTSEGASDAEQQGFYSHILGGRACV